MCYFCNRLASIIAILARKFKYDISFEVAKYLAHHDNINTRSIDQFIHCTEVCKKQGIINSPIIFGSQSVNLRSTDIHVVFRFSNIICRVNYYYNHKYDSMISKMNCYAKKLKNEHKDMEISGVRVRVFFNIVTSTTDFFYNDGEFKFPSLM